MIDAKNIIYLPRWIKLLALVMLVASMICAIYITWHFIGMPEKADWILVSMSLAQFAVTAMVICVAVIFAEREANVAVLSEMTENFLRHQMPEGLRKLVSPARGAAPAKVTFLGLNGIFGATYRVEFAQNPKLDCRIWVGLNVDRVLVIYFLSVDKNKKTLPEMRKTFQFTFGGAESVGYKVNFQPAVLEGEKLISIGTALYLKKDVLSNPQRKLFLIQDIAMMTQSFINTAHRHGIDLNTRHPPQPL